MRFKFRSFLLVIIWIACSTLYACSHPDYLNTEEGQGSVAAVQMGGAMQGNQLHLAGTVSTIAGNTGVSGADDGVSSTALFNSPCGITTDGTNLYVADTGNNTIRQIVISTGAVKTLAGSAGSSGAADGAGAAARFNAPQGITTDGTNLYVADTGNNTIRQIGISTGAVTTFAGTAGKSGSGDGNGTGALFNSPKGITTDGTYLYVTDNGNNKIRQIALYTSLTPQLNGQVRGRVTSLESITTQSGGSALLNFPCGITTDGSYLYMSNSGDNTVQLIGTTGGGGTLAGTIGSSGFEDGIGSAALFNVPQGITTDGIHLYVTDTGNNTIRVVIVSSTSVVTVVTIAGTPGVSGSADGTGSVASFNVPVGITTDGTRLYVTDKNNNTIRKIQ